MTVIEKKSFVRVNHRVLLTIDAAVNLLLGFLLLLFPVGTIAFFGLPTTNSYFYTSILGAVIFGIGIALLLELSGGAKGIRGLGLGGAIVINFCGAGALFAWLIFVHLNIPVRGQIVLWAVAIVVFSIGLAETASRAWGSGNNRDAKKSL